MNTPNYKVIISQNHVLLLSDEGIKDGDVFYNTKTNMVFSAGTDIKSILNAADMKVIAGNGKGLLPSVNEASLDKCLANKEERIIAEIASNAAIKEGYSGMEEDGSCAAFENGVTTGFKLCELQNKGKDYTEEDMRNAWQLSHKQAVDILKGYSGERKTFEEYLTSLQKPIIYDCEIKMEELPVEWIEFHPTLNENNEYTITKIK